MWTNPKYQRPAEPSLQAPEPSGRLLAAIPRPGGRFGPPSELRISLDEYQQRPYVSVRLWTKGPDGRFWPSKKGCSVRVGEAEAVADALVEAARIVDQDHPRPGPMADRRGPRRGERCPGSADHRLATPRGQATSEYDSNFDEFGGS